MPYSSSAISVTTYAQDVRTIESGILEAVTVRPEITGIGNAQAFAELYIGTTETPEPQPLIILTSGYFGAMHMIGWTGQIVMEPSFCILTRIWHQGTAVFRLNFMTLSEV